MVKKEKLSMVSWLQLLRQKTKVPKPDEKADEIIFAVKFWR